MSAAKHAMALAVTFALSFVAAPSHAQVIFSRACPFGEIPTPLQLPFVLFSYAVGSAPLSKFANLPFLSTTDKNKHFVLESITANYGSVKFFLYAENKAYRLYQSNDLLYASDKYLLETGFKSDGWSSNTLPDSVLTDPAISPLFVNRGLGILANARAGHPEIIQLWNQKKSGGYRDFWVVIGQHYVYDASSKQSMYVGKSRATDCNLFEWGLGIY